MLDAKYLQNLDALSGDDLDRYICHILGLDVIDEVDRETKVDLARYATCRRRATSAREKGWIRWAELSERRAREAYDRLPEYARW